MINLSEVICLIIDTTVIGRMETSKMKIKF